MSRNKSQIHKAQNRRQRSRDKNTEHPLPKMRGKTSRHGYGCGQKYNNYNGKYEQNEE
jgi:hypothetical protein